MPDDTRRRADDPRIDRLLDAHTDLDKRLALLEQRQGHIAENVREALHELKGLGEFRSEMMGAAKFSRIIQLLLAIAIALITLGNAMGVQLGSGR